MSLDVSTVQAFTQGRLDQDDAETERQLDAAVAAARAYCGWHVTPVLVDQEITLDGPGTHLLVLPTLKLTDLSDVTEDEVALTLTDLNWSARGLIQKKSGHWWSQMFGAIVVIFSHGYTSAAAQDFESAIFSAIARGAFSTETSPRVIGPFQYSDTTAGALFTEAERAVLDRYSLEKSA